MIRWPHGDPDSVARSITAQSAYRHAPASGDTPPSPSLIEIIWQWIVDHVLRPLFGPVVSAFSHSKGAGTLVGTVLIAIALLAFAYLIFRLAVAFVGPAFARKGDGGESRPLEPERTREDWLAIARDAAARGEYARAIAALFAAALAELDERSVVAFDPARTPGEYRRLVRQASRPASPPFDDLTERFVRAAYAPSAPGRDDFDAAARAFATFEPLVAH